MKSWRRTLAIGFIIAITSQLYWNVFVNNFRVSASVILLPVLIMTVGSQIHTMTICTVTSIIVFLFQIRDMFIPDLQLEHHAVHDIKERSGHRKLYQHLGWHSLQIIYHNSE